VVKGRLRIGRVGRVGQVGRGSEPDTVVTQ